MNRKPVPVEIHSAVHKGVQLAAHVLTEPGRRIRPAEVRRNGSPGKVEVDPELLERSIRFFRRYKAKMNHPVQNKTLAIHRIVGVVQGIVARGAGRQNCQYRRLGQRYIAGAVPKEELAGGLHPENARPHIYLIKVNLKDLVLGEAALHLNSPPKLRDLPADSHFPAVKKERSGYLLGNRRAATQMPPDKLPVSGAGYSPNTKPPMVEKVRVFAG
jgi:hypothetical protein